LGDLKERRGYSHLKEKALVRTMWRARFGRGFGPVVRQTTKMNDRKKIRDSVQSYASIKPRHISLKLVIRYDSPIRYFKILKY
jgi:hypothetical protein